MKTMEKPGETPRSTELSQADDDTVSQATVRDANLSRRKWMRGAAAMAPVVLTLRSGSLAAQSMIPVKTVGTIDFKEPEGWLLATDSSRPPPTGGDICVTDPKLVDQFRIAAGEHANGTVTVVAQSTTSKAKYYCQNGMYSPGQHQVAILSSASANSLLPG